MTKKLAPALALCVFLAAAGPCRGQNGPDNDADAAPGYTNSVFHHEPFDSINLYNGQLTVPISVGPSYPIGPKLRLQLTLVYNSKVDDYGAPSPSSQSSEFSYMPLVGNSALGIGWEMSLGAIKDCKHGLTSDKCYVGPDGSQHLFTATRGNGRVTSDGSQLFLKGSGPYEMWDADGNRHLFDKQASGFDDPTFGTGYTHDFGRGRDGWYLGSLTDPFGNGYTVTYWTGANPLWTYGASACSPAITALMRMRAPTGTGGWIPREITLPSGQPVRIERGHNGFVDGMVTGFTFPVFANGALSSRTWTLAYAPPQPYVRSCDGGAGFTAELQRLAELRLPSDLTGAPRYRFDQNPYLAKVTLPTGGTFEYCYGVYHFFHGRAGAVEPGCPGLPIPVEALTETTGYPYVCAGSGLVESPPNIPPTCTEDNEARWHDAHLGIVQRKETEPVRGRVSTTRYAQYSFPFGESGSAGSPAEPQTLTVVVLPPTDRNAPGSPGRRRAKATLFLASPKIGGNGTTRASVPGDRVGADVEERVFEKDPNVAAPASPACPGGAADAPFCSSKAIRTVRRGFEYDDAANLEGNRRVVSERTIYGAGTCAGCPYHQVAFSNSASDWESSGRHYETETHTGTLGADGRTIFTDWTPSNWLTGPPAGGRVLPNLFSQRRVSEGASVRDELTEFDPATGFQKGSIVYDAARDLAFLKCRYPDSDGSLDKEFTRTFASSSAPAAAYCSNNHPVFPPSVGTDGDAFGRDYTWQNGELLSARWVHDSVSTPTFLTRSYVRDATTGWERSSSDSAGRTTVYVYDGLGRVTRVTPPAPSELSTFVCYEGPNATSAYRASSALACPVSPVNPGLQTWEHYDYDGLGRTIRERKRLPASQVSKRFTLFDEAGNAYFSSEWVADSTPETVAGNLATACVFSDGNFATARPGSAPGTYRLCFDPFGRPQQVVGSKHSSLGTVDRKDGTTWYSATRESSQAYCVNGTFTNPQSASCSAGGLNAVTTARKDAFGRTVSVTEPSGDTTSYAWDVNGKLTGVAQGVQTRTFSYDAAGLLRSQSTPEEGAIVFEAIGSLGNVRQEKRPGNLAVTRKFDFAGRVTQEDAGGETYLVQCYDGSGVCADGSPNFPGGAYPAGKLTRRYGFNHLPTAGPVVDETFEYSDPAGRLTRQTTATGNGGLSASVSQTWTYDSLGLPAVHGHPRTSGAFPVAFGYSQALPTSVSGNGTPVVTAATYNADAGLASWTAGNSGTPRVTTIAPDPSLLPRPASISNPLWSSGAYTYDAAGNILAMGSSDVFGYDSRSRLVWAKYSGVQRGFVYDRYGNLSQNGSSTFTIDPAKNRIVSGGAAYDARGNLTKFGPDTMAFDALDRQYRNTGANADWVYLFNGAGERLVKFPAKAPVLRREIARYVAEANILAKGWSLPACAGVFQDVACSDPDARHIQLVFDEGVTGGCGANPLQYCPNSTLNRAQMAVFLVKGYKPEGFAPPPCQGTFQDVTCGGPYAPFAPWVEQLYRDGVTAGCGASPLKFCPGNAVGEWEILVWLAKAPGTTPGSSLWSQYHPVPRGAIYTFRDDSNRVVTEMAGGSSGASTATLAVTRDNVFLGNLLVGSYVASPAGWQYTVSDHLGSPRAVFNQSGQLVETHKYWPYGEETVAAPPVQRLAYCLMERDSESTRFHDHARNHDFKLGRFLSPDRVGGTPANPQSWNRYAYTLNNPMTHVDPDGNVAVGFTGLFNKSTSGVHSIASAFARNASIGPTQVFRHQDVKKAFDWLMTQYLADKTQPVVLFGHSRGAAASLRLARMLAAAGVQVDLLLTIDPVMFDPALDHRVPTNVMHAVNYYQSVDMPLLGLYITGDSDSTEIENRRFDGSHGQVDDYVAGAPADLEVLMTHVLAEMRSRQEQARRAACDSQPKPCSVR